MKREDADPSALAVGELVGPHGLHGVVKVKLYNRGSTTLKTGLAVSLRREARRSEHEIRAVQPVASKGQMRVKLSGVDDRDAAEAIRGAVLWVARDRLPPLADDEFYLADAIGLPVTRSLADGTTQELGVVSSFIANGPQDLFEIVWRSPDGARHTWLLPVLPRFIDTLDERELRVRVPIGMLPEPLERDEPDEPDEQTRLETEGAP